MICRSRLPVIVCAPPAPSPTSLCRQFTYARRFSVTRGSLRRFQLYTDMQTAMHTRVSGCLRSHCVLLAALPRPAPAGPLAQRGSRAEQHAARASLAGPAPCRQRAQRRSCAVHAVASVPAGLDAESYCCVVSLGMCPRDGLLQRMRAQSTPMNAIAAGHWRAFWPCAPPRRACAPLTPTPPLWTRFPAILGPGALL